MNGWEFLNAFHSLEKRKEVPVIMLASSIDPQDIKKPVRIKK